MQRAQFALIGAPIDCEAKPDGCTQAPEVLRRLGLRDAIGASVDLNDMPIRITDPTRDPETGIIGYDSVERLTREVRAQISGIIASGKVPVVQGGCCSMVMGAMAGAKDTVDKLGLIYIDGHMDLYTGETSPEGLCADMPVAILLGYGPTRLAPAMGAASLLPPEDLILLGFRDEEIARPLNSLMPEDFQGHLKHHNVHELRRIGISEVVRQSFEHTQARSLSFWVHIDWDVMDETALPSADYLMPNGLTWAEIIELVRPFVQSSRMIGISLADYNPDNDPDMSDGKKIIAALKKIFEPKGSDATSMS